MAVVSLLAAFVIFCLIAKIGFWRFVFTVVVMTIIFCAVVGGFQALFNPHG